MTLSEQMRLSPAREVVMARQLHFYLTIELRKYSQAIKAKMENWARDIAKTYPLESIFKAASGPKV